MCVDVSDLWPIHTSFRLHRTHVGVGGMATRLHDDYKRQAVLPKLHMAWWANKLHCTIYNRPRSTYQQRHYMKFRGIVYRRGIHYCYFHFNMIWCAVCYLSSSSIAGGGPHGWSIFWPPWKWKGDIRCKLMRFIHINSIFTGKRKIENNENWW